MRHNPVAVLRRLPPIFAVRACVLPHRGARRRRRPAERGLGRPARARTRSTRRRPPRRSWRTRRRGRPSRSSSPARSAYRDGEFLYQDFLLRRPRRRRLAGPRRPARRRATSSSPRRPARSRTRPTRSSRTTRPTSSSCASSRSRTRRRSGSRSTRSRTRSAPPFTIALGHVGRREGVAARRGRPLARRAVPHRCTATTAELRRRRTGATVSPAPTATVDLRAPPGRRPGPARAPGTPGARRSAWPAGVGPLGRRPRRVPRPRAAGGHARPRPAARRPGGAALFNVGLPLRRAVARRRRSTAAGVTIGDAAAGAAVDGAWWRERAQADALRLGDVSRLQRRGRLRQARATAPTTSRRVPKTGPMNRILASRHDFGQGIDHAQGLLRPRRRRCSARCHVQRPLRRPAAAVRALRAGQAAAGGRLRPDAAAALAVGQLQPVRGTRNQSQLGERGAGSLVVTPARPRARRLLRRHRGGRHLRGLGRRRPPLRRSTRTGRSSAATRWAASAPTACSRAGRTCSRAGSPSSARRAASSDQLRVAAQHAAA